LATYAIGDIQGCFDELQLLLSKIDIQEDDEMWFVGDLVNRGPKSLETLRFIKSLGNRAKIVLGNHDLHLLAIYYSSAKLKSSDTLRCILDADDCPDLMHWLKSQPLIHFNSQLNTVMSHAGIPENWTIKQALSRSKEVETKLQSNNFTDYFEDMYGNTPDTWDNSLTGQDRLRCITNYLTRMRFCSKNHQLELSFKGEIGQQPAGLIPWFELHDKQSSNYPRILFGHWAALMGKTSREHIIALDTGCVWGETMTAFCIESQEYFSVKSLNQA
jgi:bis(5'-nucleosyl)-tetraphosphatase (symmetrical)